MSLDIENLLQFYGIPYVTQGHKHVRYGWVQVKCPFCVGNEGWHLGYSQKHDWWNCWRCGYHKTYEVLFELLNNNKAEVKEALSKFLTNTIENHEVKDTPNKLILPEGLMGLTPRAIKYCKQRRYNPEKLVREWYIKSTNVFDKYKYRIYIPITYDNKLVSFQCRDVTDLSDYRYLGASLDQCLMNYKTLLYGADKNLGDVCVVVEGIFDVWRLGVGAVATFGIKYTHEQVAELCRRYKQIHILYDNEPTANQSADNLKNTLKVLGKDAIAWELEKGDPDNLKQEEADKFMEDIIGKSRCKYL